MKHVCMSKHENNARLLSTKKSINSAIRPATFNATSYISSHMKSCNFLIVFWLMSFNDLLANFRPPI